MRKLGYQKNNLFRTLKQSRTQLSPISIAHFQAACSCITLREVLSIRMYLHSNIFALSYCLAPPLVVFNAT
jgi:hypothetical protein